MKHSLWLALIAFSPAALACYTLPTSVRLAGSSFAGESLLIGDHSKGVGMTTGDETFYFDHGKSKWCLKSKGSDTPICDFKAGDSLKLTDTNNPDKAIGLVEFNNQKKTYFIFSIDAKGKKDLSKPYLKFTETLEKGEKTESGISATETLTGETVNADPAGRVRRSRIGTLNSAGEFIPLKFRSLSVPTSKTDEPALDLGGHEIVSAGCGAPKVSPYNGASATFGSEATH